MNLANALQTAWRKRGLVARLLLPIAFLLRGLVFIRRTLYRLQWLRSIHVGAPVIVIGNIFVGGTGKTPLTIWLVKALIAKGWSPGVVSRGYGAAYQNNQEVKLDGGFLGDEPKLIATKTGVPVFVGHKRAHAAQALLRQYPHVNVIVADDGLQHYALARQLEIALVDDRLCGNGWLLPAGPLREPVSRLTEVDAIVLHGRIRSRFHKPVFRMRLHGDYAIHLSTGKRKELSAFRGMKVLAAAGIGRPQRFFSLLTKQGISCRTLFLPDHFDFRTNPFKWAREPIILVTEKDAVKCDALNDARLWAVPVEAQLNQSFIDFVVEKLHGSPAT